MSKTHLDKQEVEELYRLFEDIKLDLSGKDFPTRTNRLEAVENMARVLEIHEYLRSLARVKGRLWRNTINGRI